MRLQEQFVSYQGTGIMSGVRQDFVRLAGCGVKCPLRGNCDQPDALSRSENNETKVDDVIDAMHTNWLHITGGEPLEQLGEVYKLCDAAAGQGRRIQIQTSGSIPIVHKHRTIISVSPKERRLRIDHADEIILIAARWMTIDFALGICRDIPCPVFVVPEAKRGEFNAHGMIALLDALRQKGIEARAGIQAHLLWDVK